MYYETDGFVRFENPNSELNRKQNKLEKPKHTKSIYTCIIYITDNISDTLILYVYMYKLNDIK